MTRRWPFVKILGVLLLLAALAGCGSGGSSGEAPADGGSATQPADPGTGPTPPSPEPADPGDLVSFKSLGQVSATDIAAALTAEGNANPGVFAIYDVATYRLVYLTSDAQGRVVRASGLVSVPVKPQGAKSPVIGYQHATIFRDAEAPGNHAVASEVAVALSSLGFIVAAPDYLGYGESIGTPHPYLSADPSAAVVVDFLTAAAAWRNRQGILDNGQLFLTGYSEGAYVTMAAHRAMQASGESHLQQLRVVVAGAGPYDVQATLDGLLYLLRDEQPILATLVDPNVLRYLGSTLRDEVRDLMLRLLLPGDADVEFDTRFIDEYLADDNEAIARTRSVHDWKPERPVRLFHGRDDRTVPYASSESTLSAMQARGAGDMVSLTDCPAVPSSHIGCVPSFLSFMLMQILQVAQDL